MRKLAFVCALLAAAILTIVATVAFAGRGQGHGGNNFRAQLNGYNEIVGGPGRARPAPCRRQGTVGSVCGSSATTSTTCSTTPTCQAEPCAARTSTSPSSTSAG